MNVLGNVLDVRSLAFGATGSLLLVDGYTGAQRFDVSNLTAAAKLQDPPGVNTGAKRTTINEPLGIAQDASGSLYVADAQGFKIFDAMATGDTAPKRTLTGPNTTLVNNVSINPNFSIFPAGMTLSPSGEIYLSTQTVLRNGSPLAGCNGKIIVFSPTADGNVAPTRLIAGDQTALCVPSHLGFDRSGICMSWTQCRVTRAVARTRVFYGSQQMQPVTLHRSTPSIAKHGPVAVLTLRSLVKQHVMHG